MFSMTIEILMTDGKSKMMWGNSVKMLMAMTWLQQEWQQTPLGEGSSLSTVS